MEFAVEEIPAAAGPADLPDPVPLARLDAASGDPRDPRRPASRPASCCTGGRCWPARTTRRTWASSCSTWWWRFARLLDLDPRTVDPGYDED